MKKIILSALAVFAFGFANAQEAKFGVKGALNISSLSGDVEDASSLIGFQIGGFAEFKISDTFSFQPELMYSAQGGKESYTESFSGVKHTEEITTKLGYLNIPLMAKFYVAKSFSLEVGPQIGFLLSAKDNYEITESFNGSSFSASESEDIKDITNSVNFGLNFGAGYDFTENLSAGLRYNVGLTNIYDTDDDDYNVKNSVFSISLGYKF